MPLEAIRVRISSGLPASRVTATLVPAVETVWRFIDMSNWFLARTDHVTSMCRRPLAGRSVDPGADVPIAETDQTRLSRLETVRRLP